MTRNATKHALAITLLLWLGAMAMQAAELATEKALTLEVTKKIAEAAAAHAKQNNWNVVIAIIDDGGHLLYLERMDGVQTGSVEVALRKARSAVSFKRPSKVFSDALSGGRTALVALPGAMPFEGGVPITWEGQILGAIGVSGVTAQQDGVIAQAGVDALPQIVGQ